MVFIRLKTAKTICPKNCQTRNWWTTVLKIKGNSYNTFLIFYTLMITLPLLPFVLYCTLYFFVWLKIPKEHNFVKYEVKSVFVLYNCVSSLNCFFLKPSFFFVQCNCSVRLQSNMFKCTLFSEIYCYSPAQKGTFFPLLKSLTEHCRDCMCTHSCYEC